MAVVYWVRPPIGRQGMAAVAGALLGAATLCAPAEAQNATSDISARIERTFNLVIGNAADLAIPLTRRALAHRFSEDATEPSVARAYGATDEPNATSSIDARAMDLRQVTESVAEQGSADDEEDESARLPRSRPVQDPDAVAEEELAMGGPFDLVAGAADSGVDEQLAGVEWEPAPVDAPDAPCSHSRRREPCSRCRAAR